MTPDLRLRTQQPERQFTSGLVCAKALFLVFHGHQSACELSLWSLSYSQARNMYVYYYRTYKKAVSGGGEIVSNLLLLSNLKLTFPYILLLIKTLNSAEEFFLVS